MEVANVGLSDLHVDRPRATKSAGMKRKPAANPAFAASTGDGLTKEQTRLNDAAKKELEDKDASEKAKASKKHGGKGGGGGNCGEDDLMKGIRVGLEQELQDIKEKNSWAEEQLENEVEKAVEYINGTGCV